jgi:ribosomal protein S18 acetylase RimI-like enzyme
MRVRRARASDARGIAGVMLESYRIDTLREGMNAFEDEARRGHHYLVATEGKDVMGFTSWTMHDLPKHELAELNRIAVAKRCRGKGVARSLFNGMIADLRRFYSRYGKHLRKLYVMTHGTNRTARAFYRRMGFTLEARLKSHYYKGQDECVYSIFFK